MTIDAVLNPAAIDLLSKRDLSESVCVVFDILRATSSIITGLAHGVEEIQPVLTIEDALAARAKYPGITLGGERFGNRIDSFDIGNSPQEYCKPGIRQVITTTTNGTVALKACAAAREVIAGALLNMEALEMHLKSAAPENVILVCAGTFRDLALEDVIAAGMLASRFPEARLTDSARVAVSTYAIYASDILGALQISTNGRKLIADGRDADVEWCAQVSKYPVLGIMQGDWIKAQIVR